MMRSLLPVLVAVIGCATLRPSLDQVLRDDLELSPHSGWPAPRVIAYLDWHGRTLYLFEPRSAERAVRNGLLAFQRGPDPDQVMLQDATGKPYAFKLVEGPDRRVLGLKPHYGTERIVLGSRPAWQPGFVIPCDQPSFHLRPTLLAPVWAKGLELTQYDVKRVTRLGDQLYREKWDITRIGYWYDTADCQNATKTDNYRGRPGWLLETRPPR